MSDREMSERLTLLTKGTQYVGWCDDVSALMEQNERLERARKGWEETAHTYAQSRGCQEQMKDRAEGRLNTVSAEIKTVRAVSDHYLEGILARIEKKLSGATD